jgi:hypothetical protein
MIDKERFKEDLKSAGRFIGHSAMVLVGFTLLVAALAMGVTLVLLPPALVIGALGLLLIICGMYIEPATPSTKVYKFHRKNHE